MSEKTAAMESDDAQTRRSFSDKWSNNPTLAFALTQDEESSFQQWILNRNGFKSLGDLRQRLAGCTRILDAGCGNGRVTALLAKAAPHARVLGVDLAALEPARKNTTGIGNVEFANANLRETLHGLGTFDFIYSQEVLHHTGDAQGSFRNLAAALATGGTLAVYVYRKKAPAREFMDDHVRAAIAGMDYADAMVVCRQITELGRRLDAIKGELDVEAIPALGIEAGRYTAQRLLYNFFLKCYWNPALGFDESSAVNYDWYHPQNCSRHTLDEVLAWFEAAKLEVTWQFQDLYGITVHGVRR